MTPQTPTTRDVRPPAASNPDRPHRPDRSAAPGSRARFGRRPARLASGVPFGRLLGVELRKLVDTRSGRWLLIVIATTAVLALIGLMIWGPEQTRSYLTFFSLATLPVALLLPVLGILTMTAEWSQRTALVTFALEPRRLRVVAAKMLAALLVTAGVVAVVALATALALAVAGAVHGTPITWTLPGSELAGLLGALAADALMGLAIGLLIGNSAVAIVVYYLIPMILTPLAAWDRVRPVLTWVEPGAINQALTTPGASAEQWQHGAVAALVWIVAPLMAGAWRTLRREAK